MVVASTRGTTRYCTGLTPIVVMASICSVTRMLPSSLAIVLPGARGDDDRREHGRELTRERERDDAADHAFGGELPEADDGADREGHAGEHADEPGDEERAGADELDRDHQLRDAIRRSNEPRQRLTEEQDASRRGRRATRGSGRRRSRSRRRGISPSARGRSLVGRRIGQNAGSVARSCRSTRGV